MKIKLNPLFLLLILVLVVLGVLLFAKTNNSFKDNSESLVTKSSLESQVSSEGGVEVSVTPKADDKKTWSFEIDLTTHQGSLDTDLTKESFLLSDSKEKVLPQNWTGDPLGGHHRRGVLKFDSFQSVPLTIELKIKNVGGVSERTFKWNL